MCTGRRDNKKICDFQRRFFPHEKKKKKRGKSVREENLEGK